jgi:hypothetical protein
MITEGPPDIDPRAWCVFGDIPTRAGPLLKHPRLQYPARSVRLDLCEDDDSRKNQKLFSKTSA